LLPYANNVSIFDKKYMPNYYSDILNQSYAAIKESNDAVTILNDLNKNHDEEIAARKKAIDFNHEVIDLHIATNEKLSQIIDKYSDKQPIPKEPIKEAPKK
jgi:hypothetical protein